MSDLQICPSCGTRLPDDAPAGLCPKCLLAAGLYSGAGGQATSGSGSATIDSPASDNRIPPLSPAELAGSFPQLEIIELLGHGGMGVVYKARQKNLDRLVALKILRSEVTSDPSFAERFNREAKTLARLSHQQIVTVYDYGSVELAQQGQMPRMLHYLVMEYVDGVNLRQLMQNGELPSEQALAIVPRICEALQYAHDEGVVHRDIKPENILVDHRGRVKIADFGLAKLATHCDEEFQLTGTHQVMGTLRYMAPEQLEDSHAVDHRADIYSLGVVFYEMLTGEAPMGHFDPPSKRVQVDVRLDEVVLRTLAREPQRRYQHASQVKTDVESISSCPLATQSSSESEPNSLASAARASEAAVDPADAQREAELAEIAPDWMCWPLMGLFAAGWIVLGLLWNFRWPGLFVSIGVLAAMAYYAMQLQLRYLPKLQSELRRESRWSRGSALVTALVLFVLGMLCVVWFQVSLADGINRLQLLGPESFDSLPLSADQRAAVFAAADLPKLNDGTLQTRGFGYTGGWINIFTSALWAVCIPFLAVTCLIHTRRYRYTWKHWWQPALTTTGYLLGMLVVVHLLHLFAVGYSEEHYKEREIHIDADGDAIHTALDNWRKKAGYKQTSHQEWDVLDDDKRVGSLRGQQLIPASWFDRYQASWRSVVVRPKPQLSLTVVSQTEPARSYVQVRFPHLMKGSPEKALWNEVVDGLQEAVLAAAIEPAEQHQVATVSSPNK